MPRFDDRAGNREGLWCLQISCRSREQAGGRLMKLGFGNSVPEIDRRRVRAAEQHGNPLVFRRPVRLESSAVALTGSATMRSTSHSRRCAIGNISGPTWRGASESAAIPPAGATRLA
jgi:hypothetical protein